MACDTALLSATSLDSAAPLESAAPLGASRAPFNADAERTMLERAPRPLELFDRTSPPSKGSSPHGHGEPLALIGKLKKLLDSGAITQPIFEEKRDVLLARVC
jgi:hypothetical protein